MHRLRQDELWHSYEGHALTIHSIDPAGRHTTRVLGRRVDAGEDLVVVVSACHWVGAVVEPGRYALVGCTIAPRFEFEDFEMPDRDELLDSFPDHRAIIERLTRSPSNR